MENFLDVLVADEDVRENFFKQKTPHEAYMVARPYIGEMTEKEFIKSLAGIAKSMDSEALSEEELATVSGGGTGDPKVPIGNPKAFTKVMGAIKDNLK